MQEILRMPPKDRHHRLVPKYRELIRTTEQVVGNAREVLKKTERVSSIDLMTEIAIKAVRNQISPLLTSLLLNKPQIPARMRLLRRFATETN